MSGLLALPPPTASSTAVPSGLSGLRKMLASDAPAVTPVRPVPGRSTGTDSEVTESGDALDGAGQSTLDTARRSAAGAGGRGAAGGEGESPLRGSRAEPPGGGAAGFTAQSIYQEAMGTGLHREPWDDALAAYKRTVAGPSPGALVTRIAV